MRTAVARAKYDVWIHIIERHTVNDGDHIFDDKLASFATLEGARAYVEGLPKPTALLPVKDSRE